MSKMKNDKCQMTNKSQMANVKLLKKQLNHLSLKIYLAFGIRHLTLAWAHRNHYTTKIKGGQSIIEYAMFIAVVVLALLAMQVYFKRGIQGKMKDMADQISPALYNPNLTTSDYSTNTSSRTESHYVRGNFTQESSEQTNTSGRLEVERETVPF